ncbi:NUDIX domain-containing protein [Saccharicrinis sp. GN24d3]|uniref:NUDIX domain-containing protein n=1 Tax=Saccharicrinis sp. GN24d3 TaxID=3458416 RepID=UPI004036A9D9
MSFTYEYPRPAVTVDIILVTKDSIPKVLFIERKHSPYEGTWAFPGGFLDMDEDLETAALRELKEETHIQNIQIKQLKSYGAVDRDPRGRTVSIVFYAFVEDELNAQAGDDADKAKWFGLDEIPNLAFDHELILKEFKEALLNT